MISKIIENKKVILSLAFFTIILVIISIIFNRCSRKMFSIDEIETKHIEKTNNKLSIYVSKDLEKIISNISEKNRYWTGFPLSEKFLSKYNNSEGIFSEYQGYTWAYWKTKLDLSNEKVSIQDNKFDVDYDLCWYLDPEVDISAEKYYRLIQIKVTYFINDKGEIDDLIKGEPKLKYDNGKFIKEYDKELNFNNFLYIIDDILFYDHRICFAKEKYDPVDVNKEPCSKRLVEKVLNKSKDRVFNDFFDEFDFDYGSTCWENKFESEEAFNNNSLYCHLSVYDNFTTLRKSKPVKNYLYKVDFYLDEERKLDDLNVIFLREISNEELEERFLPTPVWSDVYDDY